MLFLRHFRIMKQWAILPIDKRVKFTGTQYATTTRNANNVNTSFPLAPSLWRGAFFEAIA